MRNNLYICNANPQTKTTLTSPICGSNFGTHYIMILILSRDLCGKVMRVIMFMMKKFKFVTMIVLKWSQQAIVKKNIW